MVLKLNQIIEAKKEFKGRNINTMPKLLQERRIPMWTSRLMKYRIEEGETLPDLWDYFDTSDLPLYDSEKRTNNVKFILTVDVQGNITNNGKKALELMDPIQELTSDYAIALTTDQYDSLEGIEVSREELGKLEKRLPEEEILNSRAWRILARHPNEVPAKFAEDSNLLKEYAELVKSRTGYNKNMGVYLDSPSYTPKMRAWSISNHSSFIIGRCDLDDSDGRFAGLAPRRRLSRSARVVQN